MSKNLNHMAVEKSNEDAQKLYDLIAERGRMFAEQKLKS